MICEQVRPYVPAYAAGDLPTSTSRWVEDHLEGCLSCRALAAHHTGIVAALRDAGRVEVEAPEGLVAAVMDRVRRRRRVVPVLPIPPSDVVRLVQDYREALLGVAGFVAVAAGAAWAVAKAVKAVRPSPVAPEA